MQRAIAAELAHRSADDPLARFYRARDDRPLWVAARRVRPAAQRLIAALRGAAVDDLSPAAYRPDEVAAAVSVARDGRPADLARAELQLSAAFAAFDLDLHRPPASARPAFFDPAIAAPPADALAALQAAAGAPSPGAALTTALRMNPIYEMLRADLAQALAARRPNARRVALLRINLERARPLPADLGRRYLLVNPAAETLWLYQDGRAIDEMPVIVGKRSLPTPSLVGLVRYAVLDPYWNVPPDLARNRIAPRVLAEGSSYLARQHLEVLPDWSPGASPEAPELVDWQAVADGRATPRLRQQPGPGNMMGKIKFVLPNPLGVYLHDTSEKGLFASSQRWDSAGCVRLSRPQELARLLFGRELVADPDAGPEQRVDLAQPVPVYIVYLTAQPEAGGLIVLRDIYNRDPQVASAIAYRSTSQASEPTPASAQ